MNLDRESRAAYMTMAEFNGLLEYSRTLPTGTTPGKVWKRHVNWHDLKSPEIWWLGEFGDIVDKDILVHWYEIFIEHGEDNELDPRLS